MILSVQTELNDSGKAKMDDEIREFMPLFYASRTGT
jgi:hypothetical protein